MHQRGCPRTYGWVRTTGARPAAHTAPVLVDGLAILESPRWHDERLWFSHWGAAEILTVELDGNCEVAAPGRPGLGWATKLAARRPTARHWRDVIASRARRFARRPRRQQRRPDGITIDAEGAVWASSAVMAKDCARVLEGGEITHRIEVDCDCFACMLGGPGRRTLFMMTAEWLGADKVDEALARRTGRVLATEVDVPGVGWP